MALGALRIEHLNRGRPLRAKTFKCFWLLFDMDLDRNEVVINEFLHARVGVNLGIQPGATASHGRCVEI